MEVKEPEETKYCLYNDRVQPISADGQHVSEDMNTQGHCSIDEELLKPSQAFTGDGLPSTQGNIAGTANHICSADNTQTTSSAADGVVHDALGHEQSLLCQEDGVNLADSFRIGIKSAVTKASLPRTLPPCTVWMHHLTFMARHEDSSATSDVLFLPDIVMHINQISIFCITRSPPVPVLSKHT